MPGTTHTTAAVSSEVASVVGRAAAGAFRAAGAAPAVAAAAGALGAGVPVAVGRRTRLGRRDREAIEQAVRAAERSTGLQFCVCVGSASTDARGRAQELFVAAGLASRPAVLVLVGLAQHHIEVVTSERARSRISDDACASAVARMVGEFKSGRLSHGVVAGIEALAGAAGRGTAPAQADLPDVLEA